MTRKSSSTALSSDEDNEASDDLSRAKLTSSPLS